MVPIGTVPLPTMPAFQAPLGRVILAGGTDTVVVATGVSGTSWTSSTFIGVDPTQITLLGSGAAAAIHAIGNPDIRTIPTR